MGCKELDIPDYFRLTPTTGIVDTPTPASPATSETSHRGFKPVVSVSISNYRYYNPSLGRWLNRDPIGERGSHAYRKLDMELVRVIDAEVTRLKHKLSELLISRKVFLNVRSDLELLIEKKVELVAGSPSFFIWLKHLDFVEDPRSASFLSGDGLYRFIDNGPTLSFDILGLCKGIKGHAARMNFCKCVKNKLDKKFCREHGHDNQQEWDNFCDYLKNFS